MKATAKQKKVLKKIRKRVASTHWIKGSMARIKTKTGSFARNWVNVPRENGSEVERFTLEGNEYKTCACFVGLVRWELFGGRSEGAHTKEYKDLIKIVADHLTETGRVSKTAIQKRENEHSALIGQQNLVIDWNDSSRTSRADVIQVIDELVS